MNAVMDTTYIETPFCTLTKAEYNAIVEGLPYLIGHLSVTEEGRRAIAETLHFIATKRFPFLTLHATP